MEAEAAEEVTEVELKVAKKTKVMVAAVEAPMNKQKKPIAVAAPTKGAPKKRKKFLAKKLAAAEAEETTVEMKRPAVAKPKAHVHRKGPMYGSYNLNSLDLPKLLWPAEDTCGGEHTFTVVYKGEKIQIILSAGCYFCHNQTWSWRRRGGPAQCLQEMDAALF